MSANQDQEMWTWKFEPVSPSGTASLEIEDDDWLTIDGKSAETANNAAEPVMYDDQPTRAQVATKLLEELDEWIKEEPFSDWLEEKIELPIFEDLTGPECIRNKLLVYPNLVKPQQQVESTQTLLQEFESVLGDVGACHQVVQQAAAVLGNTLTPPQSPPPNKGINVNNQLLVTLQPVQQPLFTPQQVTYGTVINNEKPAQIFIGQLPAEKQLVSSEKQSIYVEQDSSSGPWDVPDSLENLDVSNDLDVVDEIVRSYARDIAPPSPCVSTGGSCASSEESTDDPDWILEQNNAKRSGHARNRHKPYSRPNVEDKKVRKKEQNKNAATRYRQKKKQEIKEILGEERELTEYNEKLQCQLKDLQREIGYLKGLMRDLFKAKGLIK